MNYKNVEFWNDHPAVLIGISFLIGIGTALFSLPLWISLSWLFYLIFLKKWAAICSLPAAALYAWLLFGQLPQFEEPRSITGYFTISNVKVNKTPFNQNHLYKGTLFLENSLIPCTISLQNGKRPKASCDYQVAGILTQRDKYDYHLKVKTLEKVPRTWSPAEWRFQAKNKLRHFLHTHLTRPRTATLLTSLATGDVEDRLLRYEFSRLGLQHILAISGFHFGVLIAFLALLLRFLPCRFQWLSMILLTTTYFLFIGDSPSVQRAWIIVTLFLFAKLIKRPTTPINLLGAALLIEVIYNPLIIANLGFQLSFGSCFGILLLHQPIDEILQSFFPSRPAKESSKLPLISGLAYLICSTFRSGLSLSAAVNITLLPLLFYHFGKFPLLSLLYNLFFPLLISLALFGLLAVLLCSLVSISLAKPLFALLDHFTTELLDLVAYPPLLLDYSLYFQNIPSQSIPLYLFLLLQISIYLANKQEVTSYKTRSL